MQREGRDAVSLAMTRTEREEFLADVHVGVLSVEDPGRGPLTVPVWYADAPGATVDVITGTDSAKRTACALPDGSCSARRPRSPRTVT
jgi:nitroimidazol reductase NimA-like FMN-containing flavoprotein (pyridoxamine 5'-phosphate oxidase superfamily)